MIDALGQSTEFEKYGDFNPNKIAAVFDAKPRLSQYQIKRDSKTGEIMQRVPIYEIDIVDPDTFESLALFLKPDEREVWVRAFSRPVDISTNAQSLVESGKIPDRSIPTHQAIFEKKSR